MAKRRAKKTVRKRSSRSRKPRRRRRGDQLPKDAVTLMVVLRAREGQETLLEAELRALVGPSRREETCVGYDVYRSLDVPGTFLLHEVWANREAHTGHTHTPHFLRWNARKDALIVSRDGNFWKRLA